MTKTTTSLTFVAGANFVQGELVIDVANCTQLDSASGLQGLETGIAEAAGVSASYVEASIDCDSRLLEAVRRLAPRSVSYQITIPESDTSITAADVFQNIGAESTESMEAKLSSGINAAGVNVALSVISISTPSVEASTTTTTTTLYCPGTPPCGGASGTCTKYIDSSGGFWECSCAETYNDTDCSLRTCPDCQNGGTCAPGTQDADSIWGCECPGDRTGDRCEDPRCPGDCSNAGDCDTSTGTCQCFEGFSGDDCSSVPERMVPITNCIEVQLVFGLIGVQEDDVEEPKYDASFDLFKPATQEWLKQTCDSARQNVDLKVRDDVPCWILPYEVFVNAHGGTFPVEPPEMASLSLQAFMHEFRSAVAGYINGDVVTEEDEWIGRPYFVRLRMKINLESNGPTEVRTAMRQKWTEFVTNQNAAAPSGGTMLMVSSTWTELELESQVLASTATAFGGSMLTSLLAVAVFTQNMIIALYVCLNILLVVCMLSGFLLNIMAFEFGVVEAIGATIFVGMSVDYCLHLAHGYHEAPGKDSKAKMRHALIFMGPSIMGGALTTIAGTAFLLPCRMVLFNKLGWILLSNAIFSVVFTFGFLAPLLVVAGPTGVAGSIFCFPCLRHLAPSHGGGHDDTSVTVYSPRLATSSTDIPASPLHFGITIGKASDDEGPSI